jgi:small subunit ribosomal protein S20
VANHPSALKRHRQSEKRRQRNQAIKTHLRHLVRRVREAIGRRDVGAAVEGLKRATRALDRAVSKGVLHRNNASRRVSRLARAVRALDAGGS